METDLQCKPGNCNVSLWMMIRNFWWRSRDGKRKTHWKGCDEFLKPKASGGL
jgi:hypothetical protein